MQYVIDILDKVIPVFIAGLFFGGGLPALYAMGLRLLAGRTEYTADGKLRKLSLRERWRRLPRPAFLLLS